ncbi:putative RecA-superfamily ATPases implicated in signal transduction [Methanocella conradii HZ254]|uniref:RecA-superfamily ATPases implicated in signal transduction n=1 Tax=Methanocella conradii (strain DSM 24694 / JCM 17849 / CGMCC 1.5162 / HZ254) TaxID=1041930 RepID=H8I8T9_METCZ|nr:ATPase domain-containing protein [Methanocella conradii]AFC99993.1 putative RecA-superfamily ATPases implicated in signal transduction [Methanocella conradii HZ254]MDI6897338.1 ATPase domain-containing protein [Methanocella conradii]
MMTTSRLRTGIAGLDEMTGGGFIRGDTTLITGPPGTGKTTFGLQFLMQGISEGESGVFVTVEEMPQKIASDAMNFGWDLKRLEAEKKMRLFHLRSEMLQAGGAPIMQCLDIVNAIGAKRVVVDPISLYSLNVGNPTDLRRELYAFVNYMKESGLTLVLTHEVPDIITRVSRISDYGLEFIVDCIIMLQYVEIESEIRRSISVLKMRGSDHDKAIRRYKITDRGVEIEARFEGYEGIMSGTARKTGAQAFIEAFKR